MADLSEDKPEPVEGEVLPPGEGGLAEVRPLPLPASQAEAQIERPFTIAVPATVVAASGGFVLGVTAFVLTKILRRPAAGRRLASRRRRLAARRGVDIETTRSFLVDVHLLKR